MEQLVYHLEQQECNLKHNSPDLRIITNNINPTNIDQYKSFHSFKFLINTLIIKISSNNTILFNTNKLYYMKSGFVQWADGNKKVKINPIIKIKSKQLGYANLLCLILFHSDPLQICVIVLSLFIIS